MALTPNLLKERDAAALLGLAPKTLARWRWRGDRGPAWIKLGSAGAVRYSVAELETFIAAGEVQQ